MASRLLAVLALLVAAPFVRAEPLDLTDVKNSEAATVLIAKFFESIGLDVMDKDEKQFNLKSGGYNIVMMAYYHEDNGCRLNAYITYGGRKENVGDAKLLRLVNEVNCQFNLVAFSVDSDGDFCYRYSLVFDKKLDPKVVQRWLRNIALQTDAIRAEFRDKLKPYMVTKGK
jgi:hypothetical protein